MPDIIDPFHRQLRMELLQELERRKDYLCRNGVGSMEDYRYICGGIVAMQEILELCLAIEARLFGGERDRSE